MEEAPIDSLVAVYRKLRGALDDAKQEYEAKAASLKEELEIVSAGLLDFCNTQGLDSVKTPSGTVSRRIQTRYWTTDWDQMNKFIVEHDAVFLLEKRISNGNMKQFLENNPGTLPVGLQVDNQYVIQVRKPTER